MMGASKEVLLVYHKYLRYKGDRIHLEPEIFSQMNVALNISLKRGKKKPQP